VYFTQKEGVIVMTGRAKTGYGGLPHGEPVPGKLSNFLPLLSQYRKYRRG
jgi:hypothetical protein